MSDAELVWVRVSISTCVLRMRGSQRRKGEQLHHLRIKQVDTPRAIAHTSHGVPGRSVPLEPRPKSRHRSSGVNWHRHEVTGRAFCFHLPLRSGFVLKCGWRHHDTILVYWPEHPEESNISAWASSHYRNILASPSALFVSTWLHFVLSF